MLLFGEKFIFHLIIVCRMSLSLVGMMDEVNLNLCLLIVKTDKTNCYNRSRYGKSHLL